VFVACARLSGGVCVARDTSCRTANSRPKARNVFAFAVDRMDPSRLIGAPRSRILALIHCFFMICLSAMQRSGMAGGIGSYGFGGRPDIAGRAFPVPALADAKPLIHIDCAKSTLALACEKIVLRVPFRR
jgi:hypothetical protein